ncbi:DUF2750 domain-containing protein [Shewanella sp. NIFS-20-20]|uniref:DUF2750 domain-containing protein n=1 Tax=Shewanella sp. NIFS-20-20 TaxID=2853806 RepID=UPI001C43AC7C|nr:DUF2750 domain-containing protein [Shewanella sp. NIFS-20-20]MBV7314266.1 DUF2750 domain-containing protein [Shewanella sp. NIFS-20-20]
MSKSKTAAEFASMTPEGRYDLMVSLVKQEQVIWTLQDNDGCVMLTTDDEDCIPMWPTEEAANSWAVDDWQHCQPLAIPLNEWLERWVPGMQDDDLAVAICPVVDDLGVVVLPHELEERLVKRQAH